MDTPDAMERWERWEGSRAVVATMLGSTMLAEGASYFYGGLQGPLWKALALWRWLLADRRRLMAIVWSALAVLGALTVRRMRLLASRRAPEELPLAMEPEKCALEQQAPLEVSSRASISQISSSSAGWRTVRVVPLSAWRQRLSPPEPFAHPHVVQLFSVSVCENEQTVRIDCERTDSTVRQLVDTRGLHCLSTKARLRLCAELASGLDAIHTFGNGNMWHGMLRDDTCLLARGADGEWTAKLSEFGVIADRATAEARLCDMCGWWPAEAERLVSSGVLGSFDGKQMDVFGLGCVAAMLLSVGGQHPFGTADQREERIRMGAPVLSTLVHGWPISLLPFLLRMLGSPASRRPTSSEVCANMCAACEAASVAAPVIRQVKYQVSDMSSSRTPLARAVAAAGGLDKWQRLNPAARREAINKALGMEHTESGTSFGEDSVSMASFASQAEADIDEFLAEIAELAAAPSPLSSSRNASTAPSMLSTGEEATSFTSQAEADVDEFLAEIAELAAAPSPQSCSGDTSTVPSMLSTGEEAAIDIDESPEGAVDAFLVELARMVEVEESSGSESGETPEQAVDAFLEDLARTIEAQLVASPVPATSPAWRIQEEEAAEYLRDVSLREEDSVMSLTRAAMASASTPSKAAAAAASALDQALTDLEVAAVERIERAAMKAAQTPTKAAFAAADVIQLAMDELGAVRAPLSPDSPVEISRRREVRWSSPSDAVASPVSKALGTRRELMLAQVARRSLSSGNPSTTDLPPAAMPPVPAQLCNNNTARAPESTTAADALDELKTAQAQVENFLSDIKTITLTKAVQHAIASAGTDQAVSTSQSLEKKDESSDDISPTSRAYRGHSGVRRRIAMTKRFTQLKDTLVSDEGNSDSTVSSSPARYGDAAKTEGRDHQVPPLSPRSAADKASRERTRQLGARLLALAKRKPALAKAVEAHGLVSNTSAVAASGARSPSDIETLIAAPATLATGARKMTPRSLEQQIKSKHANSGVRVSVQSGVLTPSPAARQPTALLNTSSASAALHAENSPASARVIGASPVSMRKGRAASIGSQQRRRRALSSIGNQQALQC